MFRENLIQSTQQAMTDIVGGVAVAENIKEMTTKKGNQSIQKKYTFVAKMGNKSSITLFDPALITSVERIKTAEAVTSRMSYVVCRELANIEESGKLQSLGFKNIADFARAMFGYKTSTSNHYARIGKYFINEDYSVKEGIPDLSVSHFVELNTLVGDDGSIDNIVELFADGTLTDGMSTKMLRSTILSLSKTVDSEASETTDTSETTATSETTDKDSQLATSKEISKEAGKEESDNAPFDANIVCGKALDAIARFNDAMIALKDNGIQVAGYEDHLKMLADMVKELIQ